MSQVRVRVAVYLTRGDQVLVFDHVDFPDSGTQVPAGGVESDETLEEAVVREVMEETGISAVTVVRSLGVQQRPHPDTGAARVTIFYHATTSDPRTRWIRKVEGDTGSDIGMLFECYFVPIAKCVGLLADHQDQWLHRLTERVDDDG